MPAYRKHRLMTTLVALIGLLFMQLAVANYVCPASVTKAVIEIQVAEANMPCAEFMATASMDAEQPNLCQAHCQSDSQAHNSVDAPMPVGLLGGAAPNLALSNTDTSLALRPTLQESLLKRTTAPPLSVRNCCFRI